MGRRNRRSILYDGCYAHVFSRSTEKKYIFETDQDFKTFKALLLESKSKYSYRIHHYCLMHTHFHLLVSMDSVKQFSEALKRVKWSYAKNFNYKHQRFGPLWRDRFKSLVIENERYLQACGAYVEGNPVEAGIVAKCENWKYSSAGYYFGQCEDALVDPYAFDGGNPLVVEKQKQEDFFMKGQAIGSELFKIHCQEELMQSMPGPL